MEKSDIQKIAEEVGLCDRCIIAKQRKRLGVTGTCLICPDLQASPV